MKNTYVKVKTWYAGANNHARIGAAILALGILTLAATAPTVAISVIFFAFAWYCIFKFVESVVRF